MSWNDQNNNNGSRDPWGNKNDAPDIDEAIKRFKAIFGPIFGGNSGGGIQNDTTQQSNIEDSSLVSDMDDEIPF